MLLKMIFTKICCTGFAQKSLIDKKPYTTLSYANGPGYATAFDESGERPDLTNTDTSK